MSEESPDAAPFRLGAVADQDGLVNFGLFAPGKKTAAVIGDWNNWDPCADLMAPTPEGFWRLEKRLSPTPHTYQFVTDDEIVVCDPYARLLERLPRDAPPRAVIQFGQAAFHWQNDGWLRPIWQDLIIYEMNIADYSPEGTFLGAIRRLDHLSRLGINAIELMPVYEPTKDEGWGYNPAYFFAVRRSFGTADDFKAFVDAAHERGIAVILDMVLAHTAHRHPFNRLYSYEASPWYGKGCGKPNQFGFPMLDYTKRATQRFARDVIQYWPAEFHVDGLRFDYCPGIGRCGPYGFPMLARMTREARPDAYVIAEYLPEAPQAMQDRSIDGYWHSRFTSALHALLCENEYRDANWNEFTRTARTFDPARQGYAEASEMVNYLESHDEERMPRLIREAGFGPSEVRSKLELAALALLALPGVPMLYEGEEWGEAARRQVNRRNLLHWETLETPEGQALFEHWRLLIHLRKKHPALRSERFTMVAADEKRKMLVVHRRGAEEGEVMVAINFAPNRQSLPITFPQRGHWRDLLGGPAVHAGPQAEITLEARSGGVYARGGVNGDRA